MRRCDSAAIVPNTSELLPEPEIPVNTVSRRFGISTLTSLRLLTRAPVTRIMSWLSAACIVPLPRSDVLVRYEQYVWLSFLHTPIQQPLLHSCSLGGP